MSQTQFPSTRPSPGCAAGRRGPPEIEMTVRALTASVRVMPPQQGSPVAHAPTGGTSFASLWRTRAYLQPYLWHLVFMLVAALVAAASEIVIPLLTKSVIDGAIAHHQRGRLLPLGAAAIALGVSQAV